MSESLSWMQTGDTLALSGELDQDVLAPLWDARVEAMNGVTRIDLSQISRVDTGGLALLAHLVNQAKKQGNAVSLSGVNDKVYALAQLYNLPEDVLPRM
ncbi:lipid asymmetry maintenance protein MlaB [Salmonella enterica subsp. enterica serovar Typhimurium]|nr:lipid asymmetry maintenance protein MlaB [Salmonella enterica subsp. enterica serovar Typhimurium]